MHVPTDSIVTPSSLQDQTRGSRCYRDSSLVADEGLVPVVFSLMVDLPVLLPGRSDLMLSP